MHYYRPLLFITIVLDGLIIQGCQMKKEPNKWKELQVTKGDYGIL